MSQSVVRPWISAAIALVAASVVVATPAAVPLRALHRLAVQLVSGAEDITIDFVRHGQSVDNAEGILGTVAPGATLTDLGQQQANDVAALIHAAFPNGIAGIYGSELVRTQETAQPLLDLLGMNGQVLSGLNEVNAGWLEGNSLTTLTQIGYVLPTLMWILGLEFVPMLGSIANPNGVAFQDGVNAAVQAIYNTTVADPNQPMTDIAFSSAGTIAAWTLLNVKNPDFALAFKDLIATHEPLPNAGQVVIEGNPTDGWTLVSWNGTDVSPNPDVLTSLFVDFRNLIEAPEIAVWHLWETIIGGDSAAVASAVPAAFDEVGAALLQFPESVASSLAGAVQDLGAVAGGQLAEALAAI
ncbi:MAG TPA: phosphoglycerate mutase family protein [Mycobacterium sp.]|nr:phosphoglycerate mutase family protein [Mycobacterium sp.]